MRHRKLLCLALVALAVTACDLRLATDITVDRDGSGTFEVAVALDAELTEMMREADVDLLAGLDDVREVERDWQIDHSVLPGGGREVRLRSRFDDPGGFTELARGFHGFLDADDPRLWEGLQLRRLDDRSFELVGRIGFLPPTSPGARGEGVAFDEDAFRRLIEERGEEFVRFDVRVTFPEEAASHDADHVEGRSLVWDAPVGELRAITARSQPVSRWPVVTIVAVGLVAFVAALLAGVAWRRLARRC